MREYLFVYGTLRRHLVNDYSLEQYAEFISEAGMQGCLYLIADYPGAVDSDSFADRVHGEIYRIRKATALFAILDKFEECTQDYPKPHEYKRLQRKVTLADGQQINAWVYLYNRDISALTQIMSGDFIGR